MGAGYNPDQSVGFMITDVARLLRRNFNRRVQDLDLTQAQWQALVHISRCPGMRQGKLADILEVQPISVARLIDRMEAAGWVERRADPDDRRAFNVYLTDKAEPILTKIQHHAMEIRKQALAGLSEGQQEALLDYLHVMRKNLIDPECCMAKDTKKSKSKSDE